MSLTSNIKLVLLLSFILGGTFYLRHISLSPQEREKGDTHTTSTYQAHILIDTAGRIDKISVLPPIISTPLLIEEDKKESSQGAYIYKSNTIGKEFVPSTAPPEEVVKNLLDQKTSVKKIAQQTGLSKESIRKIKRKKRQQELKDKRERKKLKNKL